MRSLILSLLFSITANAGLPPTSTKGSGDSSPVTTFEIDMPNIPITHTGTKGSVGAIPNAAFASMADSTIKSNISGASAVPADNGLSAIIDHVFGSTRGSILERGASGWQIVAPSSTSGQPYISNGTGADPSYQTTPIGGGGTGQTTATAAFDALSPCSTQGNIMYYNGTHWVCLAVGTSGQLLQSGGAAANPSWVTSSANPPASEVTVDSGNGYGSTNTSVRRYSNIRKNVGSDITYADSATLGGTFTINTTGRYAVSRHDGNTGTMGYIGIVVNGTSLSGAVGTLTYAQGVRALAGGAQSGVPEPVTWTGNLTTGDVIYMQDASNTACNFTDARSMVTVARLN